MSGAAFAALLLIAQPASPPRTQVHFQEPAGMKIFWVTAKKDGKSIYSTVPLETPGRFNFLQGATFRLKVTHLPGRPGLELFPTLEIAPANLAAREFLAHNAVPIRLTEDDINLVVKGNFLVKVVYLPNNGGADAELATLAGQDAVREAMRRGQVLAVLRIGTIDLD